MYFASTTLLSSTTRCSWLTAAPVLARLLKERIESLPNGELLLRQEAAERLLLQSGITFNVYGDSAATEKIFP
jgi:uncharacterized circularly permuted ATP-grasp superfamily protein